MKTVCWVVGAIVAFAASGTVTAGPHTPGHAHSAALSDLDKDYLKETAQSNIEELRFAPVVQSHAKTAAARQYGLRMKRDHARAEAKLEQLARRVGYRLPSHVSEDQTHIMTRLGRLQGNRFDTAYKREMLRDHSEDINRTKRELSLGRNPHVLASARENLRLLQTHLALANRLPGQPFHLPSRK